jgi:hypothetical protein
MPDNLRKFILRSGGVMLVVLGILHLAVTPLIARFIEQNVPAASADWLTPPMLLNHVVVGILLIPLGILTFYATPSVVLGERWALVVTRTSAVTIALLPVILFVVMGTRYFKIIPFLVAAIIACIAALTLLAAAFWPGTPSAT